MLLSVQEKQEDELINERRRQAREVRNSSGNVTGLCAVYVFN